MSEQRTVTIASEVGLHARPAAAFVKEASRFTSDIKVRLGDREASAKSILDVLTLDAGHGAEVVLVADGPDAAEALEALGTLIESGEPETAGQQ